MNTIRSEVTFNDIKDAFAYTKVMWNGETAYDDYLETGIYSEFDGTEITEFEEKYGNKKIYSLYARVVDFHHFELYIEGE